MTTPPDKPKRHEPFNEALLIPGVVVSLFLLCGFGTGAIPSIIDAMLKRHRIFNRTNHEAVLAECRELMEAENMPVRIAPEYLPEHLASLNPSDVHVRRDFVLVYMRGIGHAHILTATRDGVEGSTSGNLIDGLHCSYFSR